MEMKKRLVDANALKEKETVLWDEALGYSKCVLTEDINEAPTVDAVEVVRCKDCKYCRVASWGERYCARKQADGVYAELSNLREDDFCSYGERREGE